jgi:hypothetical protein
VKVGTQTRKLRGQRQQEYDEKKTERGKAQSKKKNLQQQKNKKERKTEIGEKRKPEARS